MPDKAAGRRRVGAAPDDLVDRAALVFAQHGLPRLAVLNIEEDPVLQGAEKVGRLEERLDREAVLLIWGLLPLRDETPVRVPGDPVPVVEQVSDVKELRSAKQLRGLQLVATELLDRPIESAAVLRILVLDDGDREPVNEEHDVGAVSLPRQRLDLPLPCHGELVISRVVEIDNRDGAMALLDLVVPLAFATDPRQDVAVALYRGRQRFDRVHDGASLAFRKPGVELQDLRFQVVPEDHVRPALASSFSYLGRNGSPADLGDVLDHRELNGVTLCDFEHRHAACSSEVGAASTTSAAETSPVMTASSTR